MGQAPPQHQKDKTSLSKTALNKTSLNKISPTLRDTCKRETRNRNKGEADTDEAGIAALVRENAELRQLVVQLSKLVLKNAMLHR
jgi:hypothetical protein